MPPPLAAAAAFAVRYRPERENDLVFVRELYISTRAAEVAATGWPVAAQRAFLAQQFEAQRAHYRAVFAEAEWLMIKRENVAIGRLYLARQVAEIELIDIALVPAARGQGIGSAIMADILADAARAGLEVELYVEGNNPARRLYDRFGFVTCDGNGIYDRMRWTPATGVS